MTDSSKPGIPDIVAEAQKLIGVPPGSPQAVFVQGQIEKQVEDIHQGPRKVGGLEALCGVLHATFTGKTGKEHSGIAVQLDENHKITGTPIVAESNKSTEAVMRAGIAETKNPLEIQTSSHTVSSGVSPQVCPTPKI